MIGRIWHRLADREGGAALVWVAGSLVALLAVSAFAVDLGWIYLNVSRLQAASDAAALAGVVNLPGFPAQATADAEDAARSNGYPVPADATLTDAVLAENRYQVTMSTQVDTFFLKVVGIDQIGIARDATAEYIKPVRLGSPSNTFGGPGDNFWAAINGQMTDKEQGDPFATRCIRTTSSASCTNGANPQYRAGGYYYGIEVAPGSSNLSVQFYDGGHYVRNTCQYAAGTSNTGDSRWHCWGGVQMQYRLFAPDATPTDPTDNTVQLCTDTFPSISDNSPSSPSSQVNAGHLNRWTGNHNCTVSGALTPGIYVLQLPAPATEGSAIFGLQATVSTGPPPKVYGILDMSIHVNFSSGVATPYLAEVRPEHAGKTLEVDIFDLGDVDGPASIRFLKPDGTVPNCTWESDNGQSDTTPGPCTIDISNQRFNADWLYVEIPIPSAYTCDPTTPTGCWWKIRIQASQAHDRTTWAARISGDPVRLVE